jgi:hypothetical protein
MAELVDAPVLGTGFARSEGSSPFIRILEYFIEYFSENTPVDRLGYSLFISVFG